jgi:putative glutamine amidotransferase
MRKPVILISASNVNSSALEPITGDTDIIYSDRASALTVIQAGGIPIYLPSVAALGENDIAAYLELADGLLITGADTNTNPIYYGEMATQLKGRIDDERDRVDIMLIQQAYEKKMPIIGICKGMQLINVALGGSLYQNIAVQRPDCLDHNIRKTHRSNLSHRVQVEKESIFYDIFKGEECSLNGGHEQGVKSLSEKLTAVATASDGIVEAFEGAEHPFLLGLQFHPELRQFDAPFRGIFERFIVAAKERA